MNNSGDAAEQVVRLSLEGFEVAARLTGSAAKNVAILLMSVLKEQGKTTGKTRLTNMIRSGKRLKVFSVPQKDLKKFTGHAKKYGVLYTILRDKDSKNPYAPIDIIAREEDASKIQRIIDRFDIGKVDKAHIVAEAQKDISERNIHNNGNQKSGVKDQKENQVNPFTAQMDKNPPLGQSSENKDVCAGKGNIDKNIDKPSVKEKLDRYKAIYYADKEAVHQEMYKSGKHKILKNKKSKER